MRDWRYGWSWRCYSTNSVHVHSSGPLGHSFRLLQYLLELTVSRAIREACAHWPKADAKLQGEVKEQEGRNEDPT